MLTRAQGDAVLEQLDQAVAAATRLADQNRAEGESGIIAGVLGFLNLDHTSQLDAQAGAARIVGSAVARLRSDLPAAVATPEFGARWLDAAKSAAHELETMQEDITEATIEDTLAKTATATGTAVKEGANIVVGNAGRFVWASIPWWLIAGGAIAAGAYAYLQVRRVT